MTSSIKKRAAFMLLALLTMSGYGQTLTQTVKGKVLDATTGAPLMGATITLINSNPVKGAITDLDGYFKIEGVSIGRQSFACNYIGFEEARASEILVGSAKEVNLTIRLLESLEKLDEVILVAPKDNIRPNNELSTVSARSFSVEETKRFPASISDPGRMAQSFAGVTNSDDSTNEIVVRGSAPNQLLWRIEGVEIPNPNHFSEEGYSPGAVSILSTNMLGKSDFFTGAFPAEYGNATSGVFDLRLRNGNADKHEQAFQFGFLGTDLAIEGPLNKNHKSSYLVNYRYSTLTILNNFIDISEGGVPTFQDISFKFNFPLSDKTKLSLWGIGGISEDNEDSNDTDEIIDPNYREIDDFNSKTYLSGINLKHFFNSNSTLEAVLSYSGNNSDYQYTFSEVTPPVTETERDLLKNNAFRFNLNHTQKFSAKTVLKTGANFSFLDYDVLSDRTLNGTTAIAVDEQGTGNMMQFFAQTKYRFNDKLSTTFGLHGTHFSVNKDVAIEPRAGLEYRIAPKHTLSAGFGIHSRIMPLSQYFIKVEDNLGTVTTPNKELDLMQATHYVLGYDWRIIKNGHLKVEAYYQDYTNVAISKDPTLTQSFLNGDFITHEMTDEGKARNYGVELTFEKFFSDQYYFLLTSSLFDSKYKAMDGNWYNSSYNYNYTFNIVGGKEFTVGKNDNNIIGTSAKILLNGGKRGTPVDLDLYNTTGELQLLQNQRNSIEFDKYFRIDTSVYYRINKPKVAHVISLDIQNLTNRLNIYDQYFNTATGLYEKDYQLNLLPLLNYRIEF